MTTVDFEPLTVPELASGERAEPVEGTPVLLL